jgi:hypothetical protein
MQGPANQMRGFFCLVVLMSQAIRKHLNEGYSMQIQQTIFLHPRCPQQVGTFLPKATAIQPISNDRFRGRMEKVYPAQRPWCMQT